MKPSEPVEDPIMDSGTSRNSQELGIGLWRPKSTEVAAAPTEPSRPRNPGWGDYEHDPVLAEPNPEQLALLDRLPGWSENWRFRLPNETGTAPPSGIRLVTREPPSVVDTTRPEEMLHSSSEYGDLAVDNGELERLLAAVDTVDGVPIVDSVSPPAGPLQELGDSDMGRREMELAPDSLGIESGKKKAGARQQRNSALPDLHLLRPGTRPTADGQTNRSEVPFAVPERPQKARVSDIKSQLPFETPLKRKRDSSVERSESVAKKGGSGGANSPAVIPVSPLVRSSLPSPVAAQPRLIEVDRSRKITDRLDPTPEGVDEEIEVINSVEAAPIDTLDNIRRLAEVFDDQTPSQAVEPPDHPAGSSQDPIEPWTSDREDDEGNDPVWLRSQIWNSMDVDDSQLRESAVADTAERLPSQERIPPKSLFYKGSESIEANYELVPDSARSVPSQDPVPAGQTVIISEEMVPATREDDNDEAGGAMNLGSDLLDRERIFSEPLESQEPIKSPGPIVVESQGLEEAEAASDEARSLPSIKILRGIISHGFSQDGTASASAIMSGPPMSIEAVMPSLLESQEQIAVMEAPNMDSQELIVHDEGLDARDSSGEEEDVAAVLEDQPSTTSSHRPKRRSNFPSGGDTPLLSNPPGSPPASLIHSERSPKEFIAGNTLPLDDFGFPPRVDRVKQAEAQPHSMTNSVGEPESARPVTAMARQIEKSLRSVADHTVEDELVDRRSGLPEPLTGDSRSHEGDVTPADLGRVAPKPVEAKPPEFYDVVPSSDPDEVEHDVDRTYAPLVEVQADPIVIDAMESFETAPESERGLVDSVKETTRKRKRLAPPSPGNDIVVIIDSAEARSVALRATASPPSLGSPSGKGSQGSQRSTPKRMYPTEMFSRRQSAPPRWSPDPAGWKRRNGDSAGSVHKKGCSSMDSQDKTDVSARSQSPGHSQVSVAKRIRVSEPMSLQRMQHSVDNRSQSPNPGSLGEKMTQAGAVEKGVPKPLKKRVVLPAKPRPVSSNDDLSPATQA